MKKFLLAFIEQMNVLVFLNALNCKQTGLNCSLCQDNRITIPWDCLLCFINLQIVPVTEGTDNSYRVAIRFKKRDIGPCFTRLMIVGELIV